MSDKETTRIITPVFRVSFPHVFVPQDAMSEEGKAKFGVMAVFTPGEFSPEDKTRWQAMIGIANDAAMKKFKKALKELPPNFKKPFHRGDEKAEYGFTDQMIFTNITSHIKPGIVASDGKTKITDDQAFYPGCYARASVNAFAFDKKGGKGVAFGLNNLMFVKDGERLDNRVEAEKEFEDFADPNAASSVGGGLTDDDLGI